MDQNGYFYFSASFRIIDAPELHEEVTAVLGLPSSSCRKGETVPSLSDKKTSHDMWVLDSPLAEECSWSDHLGWLNQKLRPHVPYLRSLQEIGVEMDIFLGYRSDHDISQFQILPGATDISSAIGIPLQVSIIVA